MQAVIAVVWRADRDHYPHLERSPPEQTGDEYAALLRGAAIFLSRAGSCCAAASRRARWAARSIFATIADPRCCAG